MSHTCPDSTTVSAASAAPRTPPEDPEADRPSEPRRIGVDAARSDIPSPPPGHRRQIVLVANVLDPPGPEEVAARAPSGDVLGHAVVDVHEVSEAFGAETIAVLGHQVVAAFPYDHAADAVTAAVEIQRDAVRSATEGRPWACAVCIVAGDVVDNPAFERIGVHPVGTVVDRALEVSRSTASGAVVADDSRPCRRRARSARRGRPSPPRPTAAPMIPRRW